MPAGIIPLIPANAGIQFFALGPRFRGDERTGKLRWMHGGRMSIIAKTLIALIAIEHIYILVLEMFLWTKPRTRKAFGMSAEQAEQSKVLAANQGLYNGFLAAGLIWSLIAPATYATQLALFFLGCVVVAGIYGGATANRRIWLMQALPGAVALLAAWLILEMR
jgi:putative membrane protein